MPSKVVTPGRISDRQILALVDAVMARWDTNHPLFAVGGFSYSRTDENWAQALRNSDTHSVSSATVSERDAAFALHYRRSRDGVSSDEITMQWRGADSPEGPFAEAALLHALVQNLAQALPAPPR